MKLPDLLLANGLVVRHTRPEDAPALEQLQVAVFPTLSDNERFKAIHYRKHLELFPEGQFVADAGGRLVGMTTTIRYDFDFGHIDHSFEDMIDGGYCTKHQPSGAWLYGMDIGTHPQFRGHGIGKALYAQRDRLAKALALKGQVTVGMLSGFGSMAAQMSVEVYYREVKEGKRFDPTVSVQMKAGFVPSGLIAGYVNDPVCGNYGVLLVKTLG